LLANDVARLKKDGKALYSAMLNDEGGILDDLIVYRMDWGFRLVVNCATREKDMDWIARHAKGYQVQVRERDDLAMLGVQVPEAERGVQHLLAAGDIAKVGQLEVFQGVETARGFVARTGYTGEAGYEVILGSDAVEELWQALLALGVKPIGLGARDTLRL